MKQNIIITKKNKLVNGTIHLTGSKSECNRALIIEALSNGKVKVKNISDAADTVTLADILRSEIRNQRIAATIGSETKLPTSDFRLPTSEINIGPAGTAMRFLTAYFSFQDEEVILTR